MTSARSRIAAWTAAGVLAGGVIAGVVVAQLGVAGAANPRPRPVAGVPGWGPEMGMGFGGRMMGPGSRVLHGEATVRTPDGNQVVSVQNGSLTAVGTDTITVKSSDGFTRDYTVDKNTRISLNGADGALSKLKTGDDVHVVAVQSGSAYAARMVLDGFPPQPPFARMHSWGDPGRHLPMMRPGR